MQHRYKNNYFFYNNIFLSRSFYYISSSPKLVYFRENAEDQEEETQANRETETSQILYTYALSFFNLICTLYVFLSGKVICQDFGQFYSSYLFICFLYLINAKPFQCIYILVEFFALKKLKFPLNSHRPGAV